MEFGFNPLGLLFLAMLFVPNIIWGQKVPEGYTELSKNENKILLAFERAGEVAACVVAVAFVCPVGYAFPWIIWLVMSFLLMTLYEVAWVRFFRGGRKLELMYAALWCIPIPLASLPVAALLLMGIWQQSSLTVLAAVVLGIGHLGIHLGHKRDLRL